jgi:hypothetical protein
VDRLAAATEPVVCLVAPPGYGKTTLAAQWAERKGGQVARLRPLLTYGLSFLAVQTLLELARAYLALDDAAGARTALRQARDLLQQRPDLATCPRRRTSSRPS